MGCQGFLPYLLALTIIKITLSTHNQVIALFSYLAASLQLGNKLRHAAPTVFTTSTIFGAKSWAKRAPWLHREDIWDSFVFGQWKTEGGVGPVVSPLSKVAGHSGQTKEVHHSFWTNQNKDYVQGVFEKGGEQVGHGLHRYEFWTESDSV